MEFVSTLSDANQLRQSDLQKNQIKEHIKNLLCNINEELHTAHLEGKHMIIFELPIIFQIPNMPDETSRREIWATIIECLKLKNYIVYLKIGKNMGILQIKWYSSDDEKKIIRQDQLLKEHIREFQ